MIITKYTLAYAIDLKTLDLNYQELLEKKHIKQTNSSGINLFSSDFNVPKKYEKQLILLFIEKRTLICDILQDLHSEYPQELTLEDYLAYTQIVFDIITRYSAKKYSLLFVYQILNIYLQSKISPNFYDKIQDIMQSHLSGIDIQNYNFTENKKIIQSLFSVHQQSTNFQRTKSLEAIQKDWKKIQEVVTQDSDFSQHLSLDFLDIFQKYTPEEVTVTFVTKEIYPHCITYFEQFIDLYVHTPAKKEYINTEMKQGLNLRKILFLSNFLVKAAKND